MHSTSAISVSAYCGGEVEERVLLGLGSPLLDMTVHADEGFAAALPPSS